MIGKIPDSARFVTNKMCPYAQKSWIALEWSGINYKLEEVSLYGPNGKPDWFWKLNPQGTVPVLVCNESDGSSNVLPDSELILDYMTQLKPSSNYDENDALVSQWRDRVSQKIAPVGKRAVLQGGKKELYKLLAEIDKEVVGPYLCGNEMTMADCAAFPFLWRLDQEFGELNEKEHQCGRIRQWIDHCSEQKAFRTTIQKNWWWWW